MSDYFEEPESGRQRWYRKHRWYWKLRAIILAYALEKRGW